MTNAKMQNDKEKQELASSLSFCIFIFVILVGTAQVGIWPYGAATVLLRCASTAQPICSVRIVSASCKFVL